MRFQTWYPAAKGEKRITKRFALLPIWIDNDVRWLETVRIEWEYIPVDAFFPPCMPYLKWVKKRFVDEESSWQS